MDETGNSINQKNSILLSRNQPVALVVGAASFLGSHLTDKLLELNIQVVGVDDLNLSDKKNLRKATEDKNFHLIIESPDNLGLDLARLDYIFIFQSGNLDKILTLFKEHKSRSLLVSSIDLYEKNNGKELILQREAERKIANFAGEHNLNARVLRMGPVFGPRMDFKRKDPVISLIQQSLLGDLQKEYQLEFSSRALYVQDAIDLIVKTIFAGSTAQKIFDGVLPNPVKVSEVKMVLLDPLWYENRDFTPSELPPWPTPNLAKTAKFLNWSPKAKLVASLRETLSYFKENEVYVPEIEEEKPQNLDQEKKENLEAFKADHEETKQKKGKSLPKFSINLSKIYLILLISLVTYAVVWPILLLGWSFVDFKFQLNEAFANLEKGEFDQGLNNANQANADVLTIKSIFEQLEPVRKTGLFKNQFESGDNLLSLAVLSTAATNSIILGTQSLLQSIKAVTGELAESPSLYFNLAQVELTTASENISRAEVLTQTTGLLSNKLSQYSKLVNRALALSILLPKVVAMESKKNYLVLLQNNMELRPGGGFIGSFAKVTFEGGKLKKLTVNDIYAIDGQLNIHVEPPKEIKEDLGQKDWYLRDSNWESDFPTAARQVEWFYSKETGETVEGVVALDVSAMQELLSVIGPLELADYNEKITSDNLFSRAVTHAELSFFPGSQAKKSFLTALSSELLNKIFFLPQSNWPGIISSLGKSLDEKHISVYLNDPKLFSYLDSEGWAHALPRQSNQNASRDFLSLVEANLGANKVNYYLTRNYNLETVVGKDGDIKHRLRINYTNGSPSDTFPGGKYKNRMRMYLPFGTKLSRVLWGETNITKDVSSFVDFGRSGYSFLLELEAKEQKTLVLDYAVPVKLEFKEGKASYRLDIIKQAGILKDPLQWKISFPLSYQVLNQSQALSPQEQIITTDLSTDRSFEVQFSK